MSEILIDGDLIVYRAGFAVEKTKYLVVDEGAGNVPITEYFDTHKEAKAYAHEGAVIWSRKELKPLEEALMLVDTIMGDVLARYKDLKSVVYLSPDTGNFRDTISTRAKYKGNRDGQQKPTHTRDIRKHIISAWGGRVTVGQEADDAIGIAMQPGSVVVSFDKDLDQLPGLHYDWTDKREYTVTKGYAAKFFYQQCLSGDPTDNIPGCEGVGPVKAKQILADCKTPKEAWDTVCKTYIQVHGDDGLKFALETARLVYIRRKENEMWEPPK